MTTAFINKLFLLKEDGFSKKRRNFCHSLCLFYEEFSPSSVKTESSRQPNSKSKGVSQSSSISNPDPAYSDCIPSTVHSTSCFQNTSTIEQERYNPDMPCIQYNPSPGSTYIAQVCGHASDFSTEMMNSASAKCNLELSGADITASATTSLPSFSTFIEGYSRSYELKPSCLYQLQATGQRPLIKMEYPHLASYQNSALQQIEDPMPSTSVYFKTSPSSPPASGYPHKSSQWEDTHGLPASHSCITHRNLMEPSHKTTPPHFPIFSLKSSPPHTSLSNPQECCESSHNAPLGLRGDSSQISTESLSFNLPMTNLIFSPLATGQAIKIIGESSILAASSRSSSSGEGSCAVCGDNAACQHYGVRTCEGCKGFFKRTVQKNAKYVCLANKSCPVDKRRRNRCQYCRFQKCLSVGMVKEVVRTDNLKGRRGRLPSKPKSPSPQELSPSTLAFPTVNLLEALVQAEADSIPNDFDYSTYSADTKQVSSSTDAECILQFYNLLTISAEITQKWAEKIPGFVELLSDDRVLLIEMAFLELFIFRLSIRSNITADEFVFCNGQVMHRLQCLRGFGEWLESIGTFSLHLQNLNLDSSILACLSALCLVTERHGLKEPKMVNDLHSKIIFCLKDHLALNAPNKQPGQQLNTAAALSVLADLRALCTLGLQRIFYLKLEDLVSPPPLIDRLFLDTLPF